ncbi:MAG TPA: hypothetical protein PK299_13735 [Anaerolineales bacterium]|nr:hypothetical protein [Anaerolineales bacterium]
MTTDPSSWQKRITGTWWGRPAIYDASGNWVGYHTVHRSSVFENGRTTYYMDTETFASGPLYARYEAPTFAFGVQDGDKDRIYLGPDFIGAGHPFGMLVDAHYYSPGWTSDLRTMVHILPDGETQVYSSLLYDGPTISGVFNGVYKNALDYETNPQTRAHIDAFVAKEQTDGQRLHLLPVKHAGTWQGEMEVYDANQQKVGVNQVTIHYRPLTLLRAEWQVQIAGVINRTWTTQRGRNGIRHTFEGPDVFGNGIAYGRPLYTSQHFYREALKLKTRDFFFDDEYSLSAVWDWLASDKRQYMTFGVLRWTAGEEVLTAHY